PPSAKCTTPLLHPNVERSGSVTLAIFGVDWKPGLKCPPRKTENVAFGAIYVCSAEYQYGSFCNAAYVSGGSPCYAFSSSFVHFVQPNFETPTISPEVQELLKQGPDAFKATVTP